MVLVKDKVLALDLEMELVSVKDKDLVLALDLDLEPAMVLALIQVKDKDSASYLNKKMFPSKEVAMEALDWALIPVLFPIWPLLIAL